MKHGNAQALSHIFSLQYNFCQKKNICNTICIFSVKTHGKSLKSTANYLLIFPLHVPYPKYIGPFVYYFCITFYCIGNFTMQLKNTLFFLYYTV
jgi:hypothetical protein